MRTYRMAMQSYVTGAHSTHNPERRADNLPRHAKRLARSRREDSFLRSLGRATASATKRLPVMKGRAGVIDLT